MIKLYFCKNKKCIEEEKVLVINFMMKPIY